MTSTRPTTQDRNAGLAWPALERELARVLADHGQPAPTERNEFGGIDVYPQIGGRCDRVRVNPTDREWDAGVELYAFTSRMVVLGEVQIRMNAGVGMIASIADSLAHEVN